MTGALMQLMARGPNDVHWITAGNVNDTYFHRFFARQTHFAQSHVTLRFNESVDFGKTVTCIIPHKGDFLIDAYLTMTLPALTATSGTYAAYTNSIGHALISSVSLSIGGDTVDTRTGMDLDIESDISWNLSDNSSGLIGKYIDLTALTSNATTQRTYYIPLSFWFTKSLGDALPLVALRASQVKITIVLNAFENVIVYDGTTPPATQSIVDATLDIVYVYVDQPERLALLGSLQGPNSKGQMMMIEQTQTLAIAIPSGRTAAQIPLPFNHPVTELRFVCVDINATANNDLFNYSVYNSSPVTPFVNTARLLLDGRPREDEPDAESFLRLVNTYRFHKNTSDKYIYVMSFARFPDTTMTAGPTGALNFSMFDTVLLDLALGAGNPQCMLNVFAKNMNFFYIQNGLGAVMYAA